MGNLNLYINVEGTNHNLVFIMPNRESIENETELHPPANEMRRSSNISARNLEKVTTLRIELSFYISF